MIGLGVVLIIVGIILAFSYGFAAILFIAIGLILIVKKTLSNWNAVADAHMASKSFAGSFQSRAPRRNWLEELKGLNLIEDVESKKMSREEAVDKIEKVLVEIEEESRSIANKAMGYTKGDTESTRYILESCLDLEGGSGLSAIDFAREELLPALGGSEAYGLIKILDLRMYCLKVRNCMNAPLQMGRSEGFREFENFLVDEKEWLREEMA